MARILQFTTGPDDWKALLARERHWRTGYSARTLAYAWEAAPGFPPEVASAFAAAEDPLLGHVEPLLAIPEFRVPLPGEKRSESIPFLVDNRVAPLAETLTRRLGLSFAPGAAPSATA